MLNEKADARQWEYAKIIEAKIIPWSKQENACIHNMDFVTGWGKGLGVYIFYRTDAELNIYKKNGMIEKTRQEFMHILDEIGYIKEINDVVHFEFDSDENIQKN